MAGKGSKTVVLALGRFKGGQGTSSMAVALLAALAGIDADVTLGRSSDKTTSKVQERRGIDARGVTARGVNVLGVDLDQQANLSSRLLTEPDEPDPRTLPGVGEVLTGQITAAEAIVGSRWPRLDVLPAGNLHGIDTHLVRQPVGQVALRNALSVVSASGLYDWIIIDTPPSLGLITQTGLVAADLIAAPAAVTSRDALDGIADLIALIDAIGNAGLPVGTFAGVIAAKYRNTGKAHAALEATTQHYTVLGSVGERAIWQDAEALRVPPQVLTRPSTKQGDEIRNELATIIRNLKKAARKVGK